MRIFSKILALIPLCMFLYDAAKSWFDDAHFNLRTLQQWWIGVNAESLERSLPSLDTWFAEKNVNLVLNLPGAVVMLVPPLVVYLLYRLWFSVSGRRRSGGFSHRRRR